MRGRSVIVISAWAALSWPGQAAAQTPGGAWLDQQPVTNWNVAGSEVPTPPAQGDWPSITGQCADQVRPATSKEDRAVTGAGWTLVGPLQIHGDTAVLTAATSVDGMCRPLRYQGLVFVGGTFAGTVSPAPTNSREDGMIDSLLLVQPTRVVARYRRYAKDDPLCCPSRTSTIVFEVKRESGKPRLVPGEVSTSENPR